MSKRLLVQYVQAVIESHLARVPNQLLEPSGDDGSAESEDASVQEFSGVGAIAGYSAPLGMNPDKLGRKKNKTVKK